MTKQQMDNTKSLLIVKILVLFGIAFAFVSAALADPCKVGDRIIVQPGYLLFVDRHKQEDMAGAKAPQIKVAIEDGDCIMVKQPAEATAIDEVGQEIEIEQDGGAQ